MRRLPIYLVLDCSESMVGAPLDAVNQGVQLLCKALRSDPMAIETAWISVIAFAGKARQVFPLTDITQFNPPTLAVSPGTSLGAALDILSQSLQREVKRTTSSQKGDWKPIAFLLTDGIPTDNWQDAVKRFNATTTGAMVNLIALGCGEDVDMRVLKAITTNALYLSDASPDNLKLYFKWVSDSIQMASVNISREGELVKLPPPPQGISGAGSAPPDYTEPSQIILAARCRTKRNIYLMRYRRTMPGVDDYKAEKAYPVGNDYFAEASSMPTGQKVDMNKLKGSPPCPYCARPGWRIASDKTTIECNESLDSGGGCAQVMFVLDVTGSMTGEIDGVKNNIKEFMDYIKKDGLNVEIGLIAFRDLEMNELPEVLTFEGRQFTRDSKAFKEKVGKLYANGGGGNPGESSLDAIVLACHQSFNPDVTRILVLITDEPPLIPDGRVKGFSDVTSTMLESRIDQLHLVVPEYLKETYSPLHKATKGKVFKLGTGERGGNAFRKILMDIGKNITVTTRLG